MWMLMNEGRGQAPRVREPQRRLRKDSPARNEVDSGCCFAGRSLQYQITRVEKQQLNRGQKPSLFTPQGRVEVALFRTAALLLDDRMPSGMNQGADPLESHSRTPALLGDSSLLHLLAFTSHYFLLFPLTSKTDQSPRGKCLTEVPCLCSSRPSSFVLNCHLQTKKTSNKYNYFLKIY